MLSLASKSPLPPVVQVESRSVVAAGALVPPGTTIPSGQVWAGAPAKFLRSLMEGEWARLQCWAALWLCWAVLGCADRHWAAAGGMAWVTQC